MSRWTRTPRPATWSATRWRPWAAVWRSASTGGSWRPRATVCSTPGAMASGSARLISRCVNSSASWPARRSCACGCRRGCAATGRFGRGARSGSCGLRAAAAAPTRLRGRCALRATGTAASFSGFPRCLAAPRCTSSAGLPHPRKMLAAMVEVARSLVRYRSLLWTLVMRELRARYRGSVLGFLWSLLNPLLLLAVYSFVFGMILKRSDLVAVEPYGVFLVTGLFPWIWVSTSLLEGCTSLTANGGLIRKAVFPVEVLPAVAVTANLVHFLLALPIVGVALVAGRLLGYPISGWTAVLLPAVLAIELVMVAGLAFALAALCVHFKDVRDLLGNLLVLAFFLAPIIYTLSDLPPQFARVVQLNPMTSFTTATQDLLFFGRLPELHVWAIMAAIAAVSWVVGAGLFSRLSDTLAEAV
ncbi:MAG: ABC transporter permease [Holophagales bacterium]|nr:ABC transporter permease [Holophagales bacterium]MYG32143.1 ABC transporter permease [Holophagales bacterium]MYI80249.1 ABC transporter permease [Holophagales bacterium]